ncbi:MAG: leucyl/phenylalanyl-tRNA--protein transferase [Acidobacteria bacterium]|nr:leucyl/phenylalanyl-tRNA--protein transferase [Acidobacteriota bacterium]
MIPIPVLLAAYRNGLFPMGMPWGGIEWFSPDPRGIIPLDRFHVSRRLTRVLRSQRFDVTVNRAFGEVIATCAGLEDSWINDEIIEAYAELHRLGYAHSIETWEGAELAGGLYGVALGGAFFGESMFHRATDASKVALSALVTRLKARGYALLDTQWVTPHLARFGALEIPREEYLALLGESQRLHCRFV